MNKEERAAILNEMKRLHFEEDLTFKQIGDRYGITRQAVYDKFKRNGVKVNSARKRGPATIADRDKLFRLYEVEKLPLVEILVILKTTKKTLKRELIRHRINIRGHSDLRRKYMIISELKKIGGKLSVKIPQVKHPYKSFYRTAMRLGIKVSITTAEEGIFQITRIN